MMDICPKCNQQEKPDTFKHCAPCAKKKGKLFAQIGFFIVLVFGLFLAIYLKSTGEIPGEGLIDWLINNSQSFFTKEHASKTSIISLISIVVIALLSAIIIYAVTLKRNKH